MFKFRIPAQIWLKKAVQHENCDIYLEEDSNVKIRQTPNDNNVF